MAPPGRVLFLLPLCALAACQLEAKIGAAAQSDAGGADAAAAADAAPPDGAVALAKSCREILDADPDAATGTYTIEGAGGEVEVYCDMDLFGGGWTRVVDFDVDVDPCPGDWQLLESPRLCYRDLAAGGARTASFDPPLAVYSEVAGYVRAYQGGSMDTFVGTDLDDVYVDGVSITATADNVRTHVWTYSVSWSDDDNTENSLCPCLGGRSSPAIVGDRFTCESGNQTGPPSSGTWYTEDPLWDGDGTGTDCDTTGDPSFFQRSFDAPLSSPIEVRLMADQATSNEDVGVYRMELYVR